MPTMQQAVRYRRRKKYIDPKQPHPLTKTAAFQQRIAGAMAELKAEECKRPWRGCKQVVAEIDDQGGGKVVLPGKHRAEHHDLLVTLIAGRIGEKIWHCDLDAAMAASDFDAVVESFTDAGYDTDRIDCFSLPEFKLAESEAELILRSSRSKIEPFGNQLLEHGKITVSQLEDGLRGYSDIHRRYWQDLSSSWRKAAPAIRCTIAHELSHLYCGWLQGICGWNAIEANQ